MIFPEKLIGPLIATEFLSAVVLSSLGVINWGAALTLAGVATSMAAVSNTINQTNQK